MLGDTETPSMNYRRGFLRAWIALTVIWIALVGSLEASGVIESESFCNLFNPGPWCDHRPPAELVAILTLILGPPIGVLVVGAAVAWIAAGFRTGGRRGAA
jgi:hypothetical protein